MSDVAAPAPQPQSLVMFQGQPYNSESAGAERARLMADPAFSKAALDGNVEHQQRLAALYSIEHWHRAPQPPQTPEQVFAQMDDAAAERLESYGNSLQASTALTPDQIREIVNNRPIPVEERNFHEQQWNLLKKDPGLVKRYLSGDAEVRARFDKHAFGRKMRTGTIEEIEAWRKAYEAA
jgi:hypothetical protein